MVFCKSNASKKMRSSILNFKEMLKDGIVAIFLGLSISLTAQNTFQKKVDEFKVELPRLSPIPTSIKGSGNAALSLNGQWQFIGGTQAKSAAIDVPGEWEMHGFSVNEAETPYTPVS